MDFNWLNDITNTKAAWVYLVFSLVGLYSSIFFTTVEEKRFPKLWDLYLLTGSLPFVWGAALLADVSPWVSLAIGIASERAYSAIRKRGLSFSLGQDNKFLLGLRDDEADDDDLDEEEEEEEDGDIPPVDDKKVPKPRKPKTVRVVVKPDVKPNPPVVKKKQGTTVITPKGPPANLEDESDDRVVEGAD
jgi:hypothetical protein